MKYDPDKHHRRSIRLKGYDYTFPGAYFITICTHQRQRLFGEIIDDEMQLNEFGQLVNAYWKRLPIHFPNLQLDASVVMPNHIHGILTLTPCRGAALDQDLRHPPNNLRPNATPNPTTRVSCAPKPTPQPNCIESEPGVAFGQRIVANGEGGLPNAAPLRAGSVGAIILNFKSVTARRVNQMRKVRGVSVWQRNYYENIIRDENALQIIQTYICNNPLSWQQD